MRERVARRRYRWLGDALADRGTILTSTRRLAQELTKAFNQAQVRSGIGAWETPAIHAWRDWIAARYAETRTGRSRIGQVAAGLLWERCLRDQGRSVSSRLARQFVATWSRLHEWRIDIESLARVAGSADERAFARAAVEYRGILSEHAWVDDACLPDEALDSLGAAPLPRVVTFAGFDRITPQLSRLAHELAAHGVQVENIVAAPAAAPIKLQSFPNEESELRAAGQWARRILDETPGAGIAVVCADLEGNAARYSRLLREGCAAGWQQGGAEYDAAVQVSHGRRLADYPVVAAALTCLQWASGSLTSRDVSVLMRSPFIGGTEFSARARLDLELRRYPDRAWSPAACAEVLDEPASRFGTATWQNAVREIAASQANAGRPAAPSRWVGFISRLLDASGWPGGGLTPDEYQVVARWWEVLAEFGGLDAILSPVSFVDAVQRIERLTRDAVFRPDQHNGLVQLLGPLEASGMEFDHLWVAGVDAGRWPRPANPLPLVSRALQREHGMPDATPEAATAFSAQIISRLAGSADGVRFSWSRMDGDAEQVVSPLIEELPITEVSDISEKGWHASAFLGCANVAAAPSDQVPAASNDELLSGGARLIALQRQNPFAAFAHGRLGVRTVERFNPGLPASLRGELLHDVLSRLYHELPSQADIVAWGEEESASRINRAVRSASATAEPYADAVLMRLLAIERERLRDLAHDLLQRDGERAPFSVLHVEERCEYRHAGVRLLLRADRVDRLADGSALIIDYKTGQPKRLLNKDREPIDPQVFVYAATAEIPVNALALFNMNRPEIRVASTGADGEWGNFDAAEWDRLSERWRADIHTAIEAIAAGDVRLSLLPLDDADSQLDVLSRIEEMRRAG